jgi:phosphate transport system substrate-binding protein
MKKILVIDRDEKTTGTLQQLLEAESYKIFIAATMKETITLLNAETFDMVILSPLTATPAFDVVKWLLDHSAATKVILIAAAGTAPSPHANVVASVALPLDYIALEKIIKTSLMETGFFGVLNDISLEDYIQLICMKKATKGIRVSQQNDKGLILIRDGKVLYAAQDNLLGIEAFFRIMSWKKGSFREVKIKLFPQPNIDKDYRHLLLEAAVHEDHANRQTPAAKAESADKASVKPASGRKAVSTAERDRRVATPARPAAQPAAGGNRQPGGRPEQATKSKRKRMFLALAAILPVLFLTILFQSFSLTDRSPLPAFATSGPAPGNSGTTGQGLEKPESATIPEKSREAASPSITIGPLHKSETTAPLPEETILRLHGSNTIGAKLAQALVSEYLTAVLGAEKVEQVPGKKENEVFLKARVKDRLKVVEIHAHGSTTGFTDIEAGGCDVTMASRKIKDKEVASLQALGLGDMTAVTNEHVIALDGIAVIVNKSNKINVLEMPKLAAIFSGQITNWAEVGGEPGAIAVYARDDNSGTYDTFKHIVLDKLALKEGSKRFESNPKLSEQVSRDPLGIGFTSLPNINKAKAIAIADTGAKPILPSFFTVATEDYPIARRLYLYTATNPANHHVRDFIELVHSRRGQEITNKIDMVDMNIKPFYAEKADYSQIKNLALVQDYLKATDNAQRLSVNFRFNTGKVTLDNRGERDLGRVVDFLKDKLDRQIILAGFADNSGDYEVNNKLAKIRAETVADQLRARGIVVNHIASGGEELPVASNLSLAGREKNRRVEVWLR